MNAGAGGEADKASLTPRNEPRLARAFQWLNEDGYTHSCRRLRLMGDPETSAWRLLAKYRHFTNNPLWRS
jgi:hypothetical protein